VFLDDVTKEHCRLYLSFYVEAANRDAFMAIKQDLLLAFIDVVERNGATLARNRLQLEMLQQQSMMEGPDFVELPALPQVVDITNETVVSVGGGGGGAGVSVSGSVDDVTIINTGAPTGTLKRKKAASSADSATAKSSSKAATAATNTAAASTTAASAASTTAAQPSPASIAKAMSNSENAAKAISKSVSPEMSAGGVQEGPIVLGSILDDSCD